MIFSNNLFKNLSFQQNPLKKPVAKLSFNDVSGLKPVTFHQKNESLSAIILGIHLLRHSSKQRHIK